MGRKRKEIDLNTYEGRFAFRLRVLREGRDMTIEELAEKTGIPVGTLYDWESARYSPTVEKLPILALALETSVRMLLPEE